MDTVQKITKDTLLPLTLVIALSGLVFSIAWFVSDQQAWRRSVDEKIAPIPQISSKLDTMSNDMAWVKSVLGTKTISSK